MAAYTVYSDRATPPGSVFLELDFKAVTGKAFSPREKAYLTDDAGAQYAVVEVSASLAGATIPPPGQPAVYDEASLIFVVPDGKRDFQLHFRDQPPVAVSRR